MIVAIFVVTVIEKFIPFTRDALTPGTSFTVRISVLALMTFFGYQGPNLPRVIDSGKFIRDRFQDVLLGAFLGAINGYMIFGTAWFYLIEADYPFDWITAPDSLTEAGKNAVQLIELLPPQWLCPPAIYIAIALAFVFILVVFI